jgi:PAS domain S-box-containing protein
MKSASVTPRHAEREIHADEMFFSTTDTRGIITAGNDVFVRVSGYAPEELIGQPHNLVRHPDMPRAAFRLVWNYLGQSRRAVALVKNLAKDGCNYWVVALFGPTPGGYLSIRFKPTGPLRDEMAGVYAAMLAEEQRWRESGADEKVGMDAAAALLAAAVRQRGFADYDEFMRVLLCDELRSRDAVLARTGGTIIRPLPADAGRKANGGSALHHLGALYRQGAHAYALLGRLYARLDEFVALQQTLAGKAGFVGNLTTELRLAAMNVALASTRIGGEGQSLSVISHYMGSSSAEVAGAVRVLTSGIHNVSKRLRSVIFNLAAGRLQIEMIMAFLHELIVAQSAPEPGCTQHRLIRTLQHAFSHSLDHASRALHDLEHSTHELNPTSRDLGRHILALHVAQVGGRVETTRLIEQDAFAAVFADIRGQIESTRGQLAELSDALAQLDAIAAETPATARDIADSVREMEVAISALAASGDSPGVVETTRASVAPHTRDIAPVTLRSPTRDQPARVALSV